ncbi:MAG TPA: ABC transporter ATP-binding protein [Drouetiella sp.]|jgi:ATP-binding cassette, subfamily B, bacterial
MTSSSSTSNGEVPVTDTASLAFVQRWFKQIREALRVMAGTPRVLKLVWNSHPKFTVILLAANVLLGLAPMAEMWTVKSIIDTVAQCVSAGFVLTTKQVTIFWLLAILAAIRLVSNSMEPTVRLVQEQLGDHLVRDINLLILRKANSLVDISIFEHPTFHDKLTRAQNEASYRPLTILTNVTVISRACVVLFSMICVLASFQPLLAVAVIVLALPNLIFQFKMQHESWAIQNFEVPEVRKMRYYSDVLTRPDTASEIRLFNLGDLFIKKYSDKFAEFQTAHAKLRARHWLFNFILANIAAVGLVISYSYVVFSAVRNLITLGSLSMYLTATTQIEYQLESMIWALAQLYQGNLFVSNMFDFLEVQSPVVLAPANIARAVPAKLNRGICFENVSFKYPDSERMVFENLSFELKAGQSVALVGENGAGKTTIVKLLSRLYEPSSGRILVDGVDLREYDLTDWRSNLSVIFQHYARFCISARENIGIGNSAFIDDMQRIGAAAQRGSATQVIDKLPDKYETTLGKWFSSDKGTELSGGEWQKIALARAFMRSGEISADLLSSVGGEAQLLILDEPTSALDAQAEYNIYLQFSELTRGKTTFLISHRFSTVKMADSVLVLEKGAIIEQGSHEELIAKNGEYARLYNLQADRYK